MSEIAYKSGRKKGFIVLYREAAQDSRLSLEARGLFAMMVSLPENWEYTVSGLAVEAGCGRDKVRRLLRELQAVGYLVREQGHDAGGKFAANIYVLQDEAPPPLSGNTVNGEYRQRETPLAGNPTQKNKDLKEQEIEQTPYSPPAGDKPAGRRRHREPKGAPDWKPERFEGFWRMYPQKKSKQAAIRAWDSLRPDDGLIAAMGHALQRQLASEEWQRGFGIPYPATWLNGRRWEDEAGPAAPVPGQAPLAPERFGWD